jgi:hypothetical protein
MHTVGNLKINKFFLGATDATDKKVPVLKEIKDGRLYRKDMWVSVPMVIYSTVCYTTDERSILIRGSNLNQIIQFSKMDINKKHLFELINRENNVRCI